MTTETTLPLLDSDPVVDPAPEVVDPAPVVVDPFSPGPNTANEPYNALAETRLSAQNPGFSNYTPTSSLPTAISGESFITPATTVAGQLENILKRGSPLQDLTATRAREQANALGMMSSSAAVGAGERALIDSAMPIAQQDAESAARFVQAEQNLVNEQTKIQTEAIVAGDLTVQKAKIANEQKAINDAFEIQLRGLDQAEATNILNLKGQWDTEFKRIDALLTEKLTQQEIDANVEQTIMNQSHDMMNQYQISVQQLLGNKVFLDSMPNREAMNGIFDDMFQTTLSSLEFNANAAGVYDAGFQDYLDDLIASSSWGGSGLVDKSGTVTPTTKPVYDKG